MLQTKEEKEEEMALKLDEYLSAVMSIGGEVAPKELSDLRMAICNGCPFAKWTRLTPISEEKYRCTKCLCPLESKTRLLSNRKKLSILNRLERTECPDGNRWEDVDIQILGIEKVNKLNQL